MGSAGVAISLFVWAVVRLLHTDYNCSERLEDGRQRCTCHETETPLPDAKCEQKYDCCLEFGPSWTFLDVPSGSHYDGPKYCKCYNLQPGEKCTDDRFILSGTGASAIDRPSSCPPP